MQAAKLSQAAEVEAQLRTAAAVAEASRADYANQLQAARIGELKARQQLLALQQVGDPLLNCPNHKVRTCPSTSCRLALFSKIYLYSSRAV